MSGISRRTKSPDNRAVLKTLTEKVCACKGTIGRSVYENGIRLARVQEQELRRSGRYDVEPGVAITRRTAYRRMRIERWFEGKLSIRLVERTALEVVS